MIRQFDSKLFTVDCKLLTSIGSQDQTGLITYVWLVKPEEEGRIYQRRNGANGTQVNVQLDAAGTGKPTFSSGGKSCNPTAKLYNKNEWALIFFQVQGSEAVPTIRCYGFTTKTWVHTNGTAAVTVAKSTSGGEVEFGAAKGVGGKFKIAAFAMFPSSFSAAEAEAFIASETIEAWQAKSPVCFITFGQREVAQGIRDWAGAAAQTSTENTAVVEEAPSIPFGVKEQITWLLVTDTLKHAALESFFSIIPWAASTGTWSATLGWAPPAFVSVPATAQDRGGFYLNTSSFTGGNAASAVQISTNSIAADRVISTWLFLDATKSTPTGYQISAVCPNPVSGSKYNIFLKEWKEGVEVKSVKVENVVIENTGEICVTAAGGVVAAWVRQLSSSDWVKVGEFSSTSFTEGRLALAGNGSNPKILNLKGAVIEGPATASKKLKVLVGGVITEVKRWILRGGELVNV